MSDLTKIGEIKTLGLGSQVAMALTEAILEGRVKGGEQLLEVELQNHFGISRSPLREAFRELEKNGLVTIIPRKGTYVKRVTRKEIQENFPVRAELEGLAARLAATRINTAELRELEDILEEMKKAVRERKTKNYYSTHLAFHEAIISFANNELLYDLLKTLRMHSLWHRYAYNYYQEDLEKAYKVHDEIFQMFKSDPPQPEAVGDKFAEHINVALERFISYLNDNENLI